MYLDSLELAEILSLFLHFYPIPTSFNPSSIFKPITTIWSSTSVSPWGTQAKAPQALILHRWPPQPRTAMSPFWVWCIGFKSKHHTTMTKGLDRSKERERRVCLRRELEIRRDEIWKPWTWRWRLGLDLKREREGRGGFGFGFSLNRVRECEALQYNICFVYFFHLGLSRAWRTWIHVLFWVLCILPKKEEIFFFDNLLGFKIFMFKIYLYLNSCDFLFLILF